MLRSTRYRVIATSVALAMGAATFLVITPLARAANPTCDALNQNGVCYSFFGDIASVDNPTTVIQNTLSQPAGDWESSTIPHVITSSSTNADVMVITIDDAASDQNCTTVSHAVGFSAVPTLTNANPDSTATFGGKLASSSQACKAAGVNDVLFIASTAAGDNAVLHISGISYDVGAATALGNIRYNVNSNVLGAPNGPFVDTFANATVSNVAAASANPATLVSPAPASGNPPSSGIPDLAIEELSAGAIGTGGVCVALDAPAGTTWDTTSAPMVATTGASGKATADAPTFPDAQHLAFTVSSVSTAATTFTLSGLKVLTGHTTGPIDTDLSAGPCGSVVTTTTTTSTSTTTSTTTSSTTSSSTSSTTSTTAPSTTTTVCTGNILQQILCKLGLGSTSATPASVGAVAPASGSLSTASDAPGTQLDTGVRLATVGAVIRIAGQNRYATAAQIAVSEGPGGTAPDLSTKSIVIARGDNFPDALAASYLAGQNGVPILLTRSTSLPAETAAALEAMNATKVVVVGGTAAISDAVVTTLSDPQGLNLKVTRIAGADRYETAKAVAETPTGNGTLGIRTSSGCTAVKFAIVASGENFPDALAAGGLAYKGANSNSTTGCGSGPIPLLLTEGAALPTATSTALTDLGIQHVLLIGGTGAVSATAANAITGQGIPVTRIAGTTRQETAVALAEQVLGPDSIGNWNAGKVILSRADTFPDALAASSLSGGNLAPVYLAETSTSLGDVDTQAIFDYPVPSYIGALVGGTDALSDGVLSELVTVIASQPG